MKEPLTKAAAAVLMLTMLFSLLLTGCSRGEKTVSGEISLNKTLSSSGDKVQISVPSSWRENSDLNPQAVIGASNELKEKYLSVLTESKASFSEDVKLEDYYTIISSSMSSSVANPEISDPAATTIDGYNATQFVLHGEVEKIKVSYLVTLVETPKQFHQIVTWTSQSRFDGYRSEFEEIAQSFKELVSDPAEAPETAEAAGTSRTVVSSDGLSQITVSDGWEQDSQLNPQASLSMSQRAAEKYVIILSESKQDFAEDVSLEDYYNIIIGNMTNALDNASTTDPLQLTISSHSASQVEIQGETSKLKISYLVTIIETDTHFHQIVAWTLQNRFEEYKPEFKELVKSFKEL